MQLNAARLKEYKSRLILFPRKACKEKKTDSSKEEIANAQQLKGDIIPQTPVEAITFTELSEVP